MNNAILQEVSVTLVGEQIAARRVMQFTGNMLKQGVRETAKGWEATKQETPR